MPHQLVQVVQLVYVSAMAKPMTRLELQALVSKSRRNNSAEGITGLLLYSAGQIMQLLEGERMRVLRLMERIEKDPRHRDIEIIHLAEAPGRIMPEWSMGVLSLDGAERKVDRQRLTAVLDRAKLLRNVRNLLPGKEVLALLRDFRDQLSTEELESISQRRAG